MKDTSSSGNTILQWQWQKVPNEKIKENTIDFIKKKIMTIYHQIYKHAFEFTILHIAKRYQML
jgi:hypothetical protein